MYVQARLLCASTLRHPLIFQPTPSTASANGTYVPFVCVPCHACMHSIHAAVRTAWVWPATPLTIASRKHKIDRHVYHYWSRVSLKECDRR